MLLFLYGRSRKTKWTKSVLSAYVVFFFLTGVGYSMQPPPLPLNLPQLRTLISEADLIAVGKIGRIKKTEYENGEETKRALAVTLSIEKLLKDEVSDKFIVIKEVYTSPDSTNPGLIPKDKGVQKKAIIGFRAGPSSYHGRYSQGDRIIVLLAGIEGASEYRLLGSGTYDKHLCEFFIEDDCIKTFYFSFATDLAPYVGSEENFIGLIRAFVNSTSR